MWNIFKILNLISIYVSAYFWVTAKMPKNTLIILLTGAMIVCLGFLPVQLKLERRNVRMLVAYVALILLTIVNESPGMAINVMVSYLPVFFLIGLPRAYQADLLRFVIKWLAISLIPGLLIYWITLFFPLPSIGTFVFPPYEPFTNHVFFIKTTFDFGTLTRFNSVFPEPGHLGMVCVFLMMAARLDFKSNKWLWVLLTAVVFSFSLAAYILTLIGFSMLKINNITKGLLFTAALLGIIAGALSYSGGDNAVNQLIIERLKYDQEKGIQGNNRVFNNTDFEFKKAMKSGDYWTGVQHKANMTLVSGAGFKIYVLWHGVIGTIFILAFYLSMIPTAPNWHYAAALLTVYILCFIQNAYPDWYAWLFPYVLGLDLSSKEGVLADT